MKGYYASEFLYISAISLSKLSILVLFYNIVAVQRWHRRFVVGFGTFIVAWCTASLVVVAFQCKLPRPWETLTPQCFDTVSVTHISRYIEYRMLTVAADLLDRLLHHRYVY
jgi:hypothetical protein